MAATMKTPLVLNLNGESRTALVQPYYSLLDALRDEFQLTGSKKGCDEGDCGACTVLMDGRAVTSCLVLAHSAKDSEITTVEGLAGVSPAGPGELHPVQQAFVEHGGLQCGFCTPGLIMSAVGLLNQNPNPDAEDAVYAIGGNLCRCTGYNKVIEAILAAAETMRSKAG